MKRNPVTRGQQLAAVADLLQVHSKRVDDALTQLSHASSPLRAAGSSGNRSGGHHQPVLSRTPEMVWAAGAARRLADAVAAVDKAERTIATLVEQTVTGKTAGEIWCTNCLTHGRQEPRAANGSMYCSFCRRFQTDRGHLPGRRILDLHGRGVRLTESMIRNIERQNRPKRVKV